VPVSAATLSVTEAGCGALSQTGTPTACPYTTAVRTG
jgi:hypothetical protein